MSADKITPLMVEVMTHSELQDECERQRAELAALRERLEVSDEHGYDGIACRDETIKQQDGIIDALRAQLVQLECARNEQLAERDAAIAMRESDVAAWQLECEMLRGRLAERDAELAAKREVVEMVDDICELVGVPKERWHGCYQAIAEIKARLDEREAKALDYDRLAMLQRATRIKHDRAERRCDELAKVLDVADRQLAERDAQLAALKGHAEAMASVLYRIRLYSNEDAVVEAYRAAYPKE